MGAQVGLQGSGNLRLFLSLLSFALLGLMDLRFVLLMVSSIIVTSTADPVGDLEAQIKALEASLAANNKKKQEVEARNEKKKQDAAAERAKKKDQEKKKREAEQERQREEQEK